MVLHDDADALCNHTYNLCSVIDHSYTLSRSIGISSAILDGDHMEETITKVFPDSLH